MPKKPSFANSQALNNLIQNNQKLNLIDGEEELTSEKVTENKETQEVQPETSKEEKEALKSIKRNNVPIQIDQYWELNAISKVTGISITKLVRESLKKSIEEHKAQYGEKIETVIKIQKQLQDLKGYG